MLDVNNDQLSSDSMADGEEGKQEIKSVKAKKDNSDAVKEEIKETQEAPEINEVETTDTIESESEEAVKELEPKEKAEVKSNAKSVEKAEDKVEDKIEEKEEVKDEEDTEAKSGQDVEEKKEEETKNKLPEIDLSTLTLEGVVDTMKSLLEEFDIQEIKQQIEDLRIDFLKKFKAFIQEKKEEFVKSGGKAEDFFYNATVKNKFDEQLSIYKRKRQQFYRDIERIQKENLELRLKLIEELKQLIDNAEASTMYKKFRNLQERWREVGQIPHAKYNDIWRTYHHHVERFYDLLHLNNDFRDLDFKHNLEEKTKLIEKAEALTEEEDVNHAFKELQVLHRMWKEEIGPVARELREEVWHKFSEATKKIHKKRHEFQEILDERYRANVGLKLAVIEKINSLDFEKNQTHKDWQISIKELDKLRDEFFAIGKVPKSKNEEVWQLFREATRKFNAEKNAFYKNIKKGQAENLKMKLSLVEKAEEHKDSDNWAEATEIYKKIQAEWKTIGHVPRKDSDKIWKRFKEACNYYFDRLHEKQNNIDKDQSALIDKKKEFIETLKQEIEKGKDISADLVHKALEQWRALGVLPQKVKHLDIKFNKVLDAAYKKLNIDKDEADFLRFKNSVDAMLDQKSTRKLDSEQLFIRRKIDDITKEIKQLENNISFISNASEDNPLVKNVYKNIKGHKKSLEVWKRKLSYLKKMEY
ncbi:DUF349 domain-containing protein [Lutimonas saemankumensis]|uniref:DUF349 domain-containing protein n=1 Tax=Lutimonas saemankumensis TaxID=483016 RepID=UPI001CD5BB18|nr:DUF349 domain-containing protein [Lutimonas saemankumensis]MCA0932284.1 DUF349 domain-containing protein [Lutimonas saemankumensis]